MRERQRMSASDRYWEAVTEAGKIEGATLTETYLKYGRACDAAWGQYLREVADEHAVADHGLRLDSNPVVSSDSGSPESETQILGTAPAVPEPQSEEARK